MSSNLDQKKLNNRPQISFIVASYNVSKSLERCLQSILDQSLDNYEVLIIKLPSKRLNSKMSKIFVIL